MKKKVAFQKEIEFPTMIGEVSAISLEHDLHFVDESNVEGNLILSGKYKLTEASRLEEDFNYKIPTEIALTEKLDLNTSNIEITDFYYSIENDDIMVCNVELVIDGVELIEIEEELEEREAVLEERECDGDVKEVKDIELPKIEKEAKNEIKESNKSEKVEEISKKEEVTTSKTIFEKEEKVVEQTKEKTVMTDILEEEDKETEKSSKEEGNSLFINLKEEKETYGTFLVYIVRQNESINTIIEKYNTSLDEIEKYNNLNDLNIGTKLIIPILNDKN